MILSKKNVSSNNIDQVYLDAKMSKGSTETYKEMTPEEFFKDCEISPIKTIKNEIDSPWDFGKIDEGVSTITDEKELQELAEKFPKDEFNDEENKFNEYNQMFCHIS